MYSVLVRAVLLIAASCLAVPSSQATAPSPQVTKLVAALNARDAEALEALLDLDALSERVVDGLELSGNQRDGVVSGMRGAGANLAAGTIAVLSHNNTRVVHLRSGRRAGGTFALVRYEHRDAEGGSAGIDYVEFEQGRGGRFIDWYSHAQGQFASATMRMMLAAMMPSEGLFARLFGVSNVDKDLLRVIGRMGAQQRERDFAGAYASLGEVAGPFRDSRLWAVLRVTFAANVGGIIHTESLAHLSQHFGSEPSLQFLLLDHHFTVGDFDAVISAIERFERSVVEDGVTNQMKCGASVQAESWPEARGFCERSLELEPAAEDAWWLLVTIGLNTQDAGLILNTLEGYERQFERVFDPDILVQDDNYAWLKTRPEFKKWAATRRD